MQSRWTTHRGHQGGGSLGGSKMGLLWTRSFLWCHDSPASVKSPMKKKTTQPAACRESQGSGWWGRPCITLIFSPHSFALQCILYSVFYTHAKLLYTTIHEYTTVYSIRTLNVSIKDKGCGKCKPTIVTRVPGVGSESTSRVLCGFCTECWNFTDTINGREVVGDMNLSTKSGVFKGALKQDGQFVIVGEKGNECRRRLRGRLTLRELKKYIRGCLKPGKAEGRRSGGGKNDGGCHVRYNQTPSDDKEGDTADTVSPGERLEASSSAELLQQTGNTCHQQ